MVVIAALNLVLDFDFIERGADDGRAASTWSGTRAFGLLVTLVWLYLEILRLLAKLQDRTGGRALDIPAIQARARRAAHRRLAALRLPGHNPIARAVIGFDDRQIGTRRWFYLIPRQGEPVAILHVIEPNALAGAPGQTVLYRSWRSWRRCCASTSRA